MTETTGAETVLQARSLRVSSNKVFGYYIEVSNANRDLVPGEYIRKQTLVGAERYITPELKEREALILSADERRIALETSLLAQLRETIAAQAPRLLRTADLNQSLTSSTSPLTKA
jgi:DNA mismatch repair protein MutS